jgi:NADH-quinone oxidoreductase subunit J
MHDVLFYLFAALTLLPAVVLVASRNTVNAVMMMILSFVGAACLFAMLQAYLLAVLQIMVYVGAVIVLFLFIVMLLGVGGKRSLRDSLGNTVAGLAFFVLLAGCGLIAIASGNGGMAPGGEVAAPAASASNFGLLLFTKYQLPFELTGFLLLAAMIGVIHISRNSPVEKKTVSEPEASKE